MLERIALHQTRLRTPGLGLDAKGVALGQKGVVLLPTVDRLVGWLGVYTETRSLEDLLPSLELRFVRSPLRTQEITLTFAAESSDRMDRVAEAARLVGAFTFTGTSRHFVQYRDASAPFGYDTSELLSTDAPLALYHDRFSQTYDAGRKVDLAALLLRLVPRPDPRTLDAGGVRFIVAEEGLGPALIHYFARSDVDGEVTVGEWPAASMLEDSSIRRYVFRVAELPARMRRLMRTTPGITSFSPAGPGVAVELGHRHPVELRACPVFDPDGLVLIRGRGQAPWSLPRLPALADLRTFARVELRAEGAPALSVARTVQGPSAVTVPIRVVPKKALWRNVTATCISEEGIPMLRSLVYALAADTLRETRVAFTDRGVFLSSPRGIEAIPLGTFFTEVYSGLYVPAGFEVVPEVAPEVLYRAIAGPPGHVLFIGHTGAALAIAADAFVSLETAVLEATPWHAARAEAVELALAEVPRRLKLESVGLLSLRGTDDAPDDPEDAREPA
jgi:FtsH ternary system domain X7